MLSQAFSFIIYHGISSLGHSREVVDCFNAFEKRFIFQLMSTVQLPGEKRYYTQMVMHTGTHAYDFSLAREFRKHLSNASLKHIVIDQGK